MYQRLTAVKAIEISDLFRRWLTERAGQGEVYTVVMRGSAFLVGSQKVADLDTGQRHEGCGGEILKEPGEVWHASHENRTTLRCLRCHAIVDPDWGQGA